MVSDWNAPRLSYGHAREGDPRPQVTLRAPCRMEFVERLKQEIPARDRVWLPESERWLIVEAQAKKLERLVLRFWRELLVTRGEDEEVVRQDGVRIQQGRLF